nr:hypothetical protein [Nonomuraea lactucae]
MGRGRLGGCGQALGVRLGGRAGPEPGDSSGSGSGGPIDPQSGLRDWYDQEDGLSLSKGRSVSWLDILTRWPLVEADLHETFGIDLDEPAQLRTRSWRWLRTRLLGLLTADTRIARALDPGDSK